MAGLVAYVSASMADAFGMSIYLTCAEMFHKRCADISRHIVVAFELVDQIGTI